MRTSRPHQPLTYDVRLPDEAQADALRLLDASRSVVNQALTLLWPSRDEFGSERAGPAWKQVGKYMGSPAFHGDRQWRCESEVVGRLLRAQAERKKAFLLVAPILSDGLVRQSTEKREASKNRPAIKEAITALQKSLDEDDTSFVALENVIEQCCNFFFRTDRFPASYEELQPVPLLKVGMLTYAGDDGREKGQAYRMTVDREAGVARFRFRYPDEAGVWQWRKAETLSLYRREIDRCWRKYDLRNRALAHLASNSLLLLCAVHGCSLLSMESLKTRKSTGRGRGVRGRWRNYRNNATIRGEIWRLLRYKCHLVGLRFQTCPPRGTSHTCPHCGKPAKTYRAPDQRGEAVKWGRWMWCEACGFNGDRDYCASLNIARLGVAYLIQMKHTGKARPCSISDPRVKPVSYTGAGSALLLPPTETTSARPVRGKICYCPGWLGSAFLQSSQPQAVFLRLCG